jgi:hypothetical protein
MYPSKSLASLARRKSDLRERITLRRTEYAAAVQRVARPVQKIDRWRASLHSWRWIWPLAAAVLLSGPRKARGPMETRDKVNGGPPAGVGRQIATGIVAELLRTFL